MDSVGFVMAIRLAGRNRDCVLRMHATLALFQQDIFSTYGRKIAFFSEQTVSIERRGLKSA